MELRIENMKKEQLNEVVKVHMRAFPGFFLSFLGHNFLKLFYESFIDSENGIALVAICDENKIAGSVAGITIPQKHFRNLLRRKWFLFGLFSLLAFVRRPMIAGRLLRAVFYRGGAPSGIEDYALLSTISIAPEYQGAGYGKIIINEWLNHIEAKRSHGVYLTTDANKNESVNRFYRNNGWVLNSSYKTKEGRCMNLYTYVFDRESIDEKNI